MRALSSCSVALATGVATSLCLTPVAERLARRTGFLDRPYGYKSHEGPTPYLGGVAVLTSTGIATWASGSTGDTQVRTGLVCAAGMCLVGTADDRITVDWRLRLAVGIAVSTAVYRSGGGLRMTGRAAIDGPVTAVWLTGLTVAFNLMDNLDGACGAVAIPGAAGATLAALRTDGAGSAGLAAALSGAMLGFLRFNLASPCARIFLGDGGSMPVGTLIAITAAGATRNGPPGISAVLGSAMLAGLPILDTTLVSVSRQRRGLSLLTGGRDHLSHRVLRLTGTPRRTAAMLATAQTGLTVLAIDGLARDGAAIRTRAAAAVIAGVAAIVALETMPATRP